MKRLERLLKHADLSGKGIEVAPYFNPAVRKRDGHNVYVLDVFDAETLRQRAAEDPNVPARRISEIEDVDMVGDASRLSDISEELGVRGEIDYIVSSHNFEHLPNPILFLRGAEATLRQGGVLSMAIPDCRACFDHFRMPSRLVDWLEAYHKGHSQPTPVTVFDASANSSSYIRDDEPTVGCVFPFDDPGNFKPARSLVQAYASYLEQTKHGSAYIDAHCNLVFPELFELLIGDLQKIGLIGLEVVEIGETAGLEFFAHLRKPAEPLKLDDKTFYERREVLLRKVSHSLGAAAFRHSISSAVLNDGTETAAALTRELADARARRSKLAQRIDYVDYLAHFWISRMKFLSKGTRKRFASAAERRWQSSYGAMR